MIRSISFILLLFIFSACDNSQGGQPKDETKDTTSSILDPTQERDPRMKELDSLNSIVAQDPNNVDALIARGRFHMNQRSLNYAIADAKAAKSLDSTRADVLLLWGDVHFVNNETRTSKEAWEECIRQDPKNIDCRLKLAELYNIVKEYQTSTRYTNEVIELDDRNATAYFIKGLNIRDGKGDTATSLQYLQRAIDLDPNYQAALDMAAVMSAAVGDPIAEAYYKRLLEIDPNNGNVWYNLGMFYQERGMWNESIESFTKAAQINPKDAESYFNLGYIHLQLQVYQVAADYFTKAIQARDGYNHRGYYGRGYAYEMLGDVTRAEQDYRKALELNPQHQPSRIALDRLKRGDQMVREDQRQKKGQ